MKVTWLGAFARYDWRQAVPIIARGIHSGIPICCVTFFVFEWLPWKKISDSHPYEVELERAGVGGRAWEEEQMRRWRAGGSPDLKPPQYVPCPDCLVAARFVELHICDASCAGKLRGKARRKCAARRARRVS